LNLTCGDAGDTDDRCCGYDPLSPLPTEGRGSAERTLCGTVIGSEAVLFRLGLCFGDAFPGECVPPAGEAFPGEWVPLAGDAFPGD